MPVIPAKQEAIGRRILIIDQSQTKNLSPYLKSKTKTGVGCASNGKVPAEQV
jgi:hypothetical protein